MFIFLLVNKVDLGLYSPPILKNILSIVIQIFIYLEAFESNTNSDFLNHTVWPIRNFVIYKFT